jgi:drug/metabolite transporter (DMT)-like permease
MDPVGIAYGISSAVSWGAADFAGGLASRTLGSLTTATVGQAIGFAAITLLALLSPESGLDGTEAAWAAGAGVGGALGLLCLYRALAVGEMGVAAPLVGAIGAGIPVLASVALGEAVGATQAAGIGCALAAVVVVSLGSRSGTAGWRVVPLVAAAGLGFATFYVAIDQAAGVSGHTWLPLLVARGSSLAVFVGLGAARSIRARPQRRTLRLVGAHWRLLLAVGLGDLGGNLFFVLANALGPLSIAVVLSSLYPVTTAALAWVVLRERLGRPQLAGALLAVAAIVLIAA